MIQRVVCFKFKPDTTAASIVNHMADFASLEAAIPAILSYRGGKVIHEVNDPQSGYDVMHYMTFANADDIEIYFHHEAHQQFIRNNKAIWDSVIVISSEFEV
jgi:hypothetical protein